MRPVYKATLAGALVIVIVVAWAPANPPDLHAEIQQRLLEAELGSATTYHFASTARRAPDGNDTETLVTDLSSPSPRMRWQAAEELAIRRDNRAVEAVIRAMRDPQGTIRVCVMASALGHLGDPRALSALTDAMFDPANRDLRLCAIQSLGMIGDAAAVPSLIKALQDNNTPVAAANAIARIGDERGVIPIIQAASDPEKRLWMIMALGELGSASAVSFLQSMEQGEKSPIRKAAQEARWKIDRLSVAQPITALSAVLNNDMGANHRMWAAFRLGESRQKAAIPALINSLDDENRGVCGRAAAALIRIGDPALPILRTQLQQGTVDVQIYAAAILGYAGTQEDIARLQQYINAQQPGEPARVAQRSIELIHSFMKVEDGFTEFPNG